MKGAKTVIGFQRYLLGISIRVLVVLHFLLMLIKFKVGWREFRAVLARLRLFSSSMEHGKFIRFDGRTRLNFYVPSFPGRPFWTSCENFLPSRRDKSCNNVVFSITSSCRHKCEYCYQALDRGQDLPLDLLLKQVHAVQDLGASTVIVDGGEPFLVPERLLAVVQEIDQRSEIWINTTCDGMTPEIISELKESGVTGIKISMHSTTAEGLAAFLKTENCWENFIKGVNMCKEAGIPFALNICLMPQAIHNGDFQDLMDKALELGAAYVQMIKPKQAGGCIESQVSPYSGIDMQEYRRLIRLYNHDPDYDHYPPVFAVSIEEEEVFGCTAGGIDRFYLNSKGDVTPCTYIQVSYGNVASEPLEEIFMRMRRAFPHATSCMVCDKYACDVAGQYKSNKDEKLPLRPDTGMPVLGNVRRERQSRLYARIAKIR